MKYDKTNYLIEVHMEVEDQRKKN